MLRWIEKLTPVSSTINQLIAIAFSLGDLIAIFRVVGIMIARGRWWRFRAARSWRDTQRAQRAAADRAAATVLVVRVAIAAILASVLFVFGGAICRIVVFGAGRVDAAVTYNFIRKLRHHIVLPLSFKFTSNKFILTKFEI